MGRKIKIKKNMWMVVCLVRERKKEGRAATMLRILYTCDDVHIIYLMSIEEAASEGKEDSATTISERGKRDYYCL